MREPSQLCNYQVRRFTKQRSELRTEYPRHHPARHLSRAISREECLTCLDATEWTHLPGIAYIPTVYSKIILFLANATFFLGEQESFSLLMSLDDWPRLTRMDLEQVLLFLKKQFAPDSVLFWSPGVHPAVRTRPNENFALKSSMLIVRRLLSNSHVSRSLRVWLGDC